MSKNLVIELKKPYLFEGEEYANIDLSGMENLTMQDAIEAQKNVVGTGEDSVILYAPEASQAFIDEIAAMAAKQPVEFFNGMPIGLSDKVRTAVQGVFSADGNKAKDRVVTLDKPYTYDGKAVSVIDLSGVEELTSKDVVRHPLVQKIVQAYEEYEKKTAKPNRAAAKNTAVSRRRS